MTMAGADVVPVAQARPDDSAAPALSDYSRDAGHGMLAAPRVNALQKYWLREIGIEKTWLQAAEPVAVPERVAGRPEKPGVELSENGAAPAGGSDRASVRQTQFPGEAHPASGASVPVPDKHAGGDVSVRTSSGPAEEKPRRPREAVPVAKTERPVAEPVVASTDFDALREQVLACTACGLCQGRRHAVFGMGARPARWMVIGEAPGEQEDRQGLPFVGRSGQLLDAMLSAVGMSRESNVFIANVIKCRPPGNRNPKPEEIAACSPYLKRQIELVRPERILVLGRFAAQTLLGTDATIGSLRGRTHTWTTDDGQQIPVVVSYHPAYLLRSPSEKARAWQDLQLAVTAA